MERALEQFVDAERFLVHEGSECSNSAEDQEAKKDLESKTYRENGHYVVPLLWKSEKPDLPNNRALAVMRLRNLQKVLSRDDDVRTKYAEQVQDYIAKGYAERVPNPADNVDAKDVWYLPHHAVTNPNKPGKVRVVFDAAAKYHGESLNKQLRQGPLLLNDLVGVLLRFRQHAVAMKSDVEAMFHQVKVKEQERDVLRFLWWDNAGHPLTYRMTAHIFGATSSPCCACYALQKTADDNAGQYSSEALKAVKKDFYMDDLLHSVQTEREAVSRVAEIKQIVSYGGFKLAKWSSNRESLLQALRPEELESQPTTVELASEDVERTLGILWKPKQDVIVYRVKQKTYAPTKRGILSAVATLYDPMGLLAPVGLIPKILLQSLWETKLGWDDEMPTSLASQWLKWKAALPEIQNLTVDRSLDVPGATEYQLHVFADASTVGYGACAYLRISDGRARTFIRLVFGKSRVMPVKKLTIPRLELQAACLASRIENTISAHLTFQLKTSVLWTDSTAVLGYIRNRGTRFQVFVGNRIERIRRLTNIEQWRYCPGTENPADYASRGVGPDRLQADHAWFTGPAFLHKPEDQWPELPSCELSEKDPEISRANPILAHSTCAIEKGVEAIARRQSDWNRLVRVYAYLRRWKVQRSVPEFRSRLLTTKEITMATVHLIKMVQQLYFAQELQSWQENHRVAKSSSIAPLDPFVDSDGVLRVGGRLHNSNLTYAARHPILLPKHSWISSLLLKRFHETHYHMGVESLIAMVRRKYWIIGLRPLAKALVRHCVRCRRCNAPLQSQKMAPLPEYRLRSGNPCFTYTGVDYFGPLEVSMARKRFKRYGCIFTCLTTRACHLELAPSLDAEDFLNVFRRFLARRGPVVEVHSDNGTNFVGSQKMIQEMLTVTNQKLHNFCVDKGIMWHFQPPYASHMSGVWERLIRNVRKAIIASLGNQVLDDYRLLTVFCEIEYTVNSRPITKVSDDVNDCEALTPNHFLSMKTEVNGGFENHCIYPTRKQWQVVQDIANKFWQQWSREYLGEMQKRSKWTTAQRNVQKGDLVLLYEPLQPRNRWPLARIVEVYPGHDGLVRAVDVKTARGVARRPISKICVLLESPPADVVDSTAGADNSLRVH